MPAPANRPQRIAANVAFSGLGRAWSAVLLFVTIPIVVHAIGISAFGIYALVSVVLGYVAFLDFGLTAAVVRSVSSYRAVGDSLALERVVGTAFTLLIALGALGSTAIFLAGPVAVGSILHVPIALRADAAFAFQVAGLGFGCNMLLIVFAAIVQGLQRLDIFATRTIALSTLTAAAQIGAVSLGGGLRWLVVVTIAVSVLSFLIFLVAARRLLPAISFRPRFDRQALGELAGFGLFRFVNQASGQVAFQIDPIVIGIFQPVAAVALYSVPLAVTQKFHVVEDSVASAYFPAAVDLHARTDKERLSRLYMSAFKLVLVAMMFLIVICVTYAGPILAAWVGPSIAANASGIFALLAIGYGLSALVGIPAQASDATGHQRWTAGFAVASAVIQLTLVLILVPRYGPIGAAAALVVNTVTQGAVFVWVVQRRFLGISSLAVLRGAVVRPLLATLGLAAVVVVARELPQTTPILVLEVAVAGLTYLGLTVLVGVWDHREILLARQLTSGVWDRLLAIRRGRNDVGHRPT